MIELIPAIDIIGGECVRLTQGDYSQKKSYHSDPLYIAQSYEDIGVSRLHIVDLDGAKALMPQNLPLIEKICNKTSLKVQFGGGIKSTNALNDVYNSGVSFAIIGSLAISSPSLFSHWLKIYKEKIILGADIKNGKVATHGWQLESNKSIEDIIDSNIENGLGKIICTDISKDGMLKGPNTELYRDLQGKYPNIDFTVSGGISSMSDIEELNKFELRSVIIGKAIYEGHITYNDLKSWLQKG